ncbi:hypothetical protein F7734_27540 [Scytonema sp. UIC 10036]|uniref:hypothetical protein n=1 Tax=Scytonema sp. UIC 10036 TaxID=2304196 RepID=UPI0012DA2234|nr:hypothetical protein [Scytonema sp. UIC 10036]MUG95902.1 hypothetical protein [Scytonema sp. UIC 10036]
MEFNGNTINNFELVRQAKILQNDTYRLEDGSVLGVLHSGRGPNTPSDNLLGEGPSKPNPTAQDIVDSLGNLNLNSILVTRENANKASIEVSCKLLTLIVRVDGGYYTPHLSVKSGRATFIASSFRRSYLAVLLMCR